jgi:hypothetical protein
MTPEERALVEWMRQHFAAQIAQSVASAPPLSPERAARIRALLGEGPAPVTKQ